MSASCHCGSIRPQAQAWRLAELEQGGSKENVQPLREPEKAPESYVQLAPPDMLREDTEQASPINANFQHLARSNQESSVPLLLKALVAREEPGSVFNCIATAPNSLETGTVASCTTQEQADDSTESVVSTNDTTVIDSSVTKITDLRASKAVCSSIPSVPCPCADASSSTHGDPRAEGAALLTYNIHLPGSRNKKIWYFLPVKSPSYSLEEYNSRFTYVVHELKKAVDEHDTLRDRARFIDYDLRMVGPSVQTAMPSIMVKCSRGDVTSLRSLFKYTTLRRLHCYRDASIRSRLFHNTEPSKPMLKLCYFPSDSNPTMYMGGKNTTVVFVQSSSTMCGALIEHQGRCATIGLTLEMDGEDRLLTVHHLFRDNVVGEQLNSKVHVWLQALSDNKGSASSEQDASDPWFNDSDDEYEQQMGEDSGFSKSNDMSPSAVPAATSSYTRSQTFLGTGLVDDSDSTPFRDSSDSDERAERAVTLDLSMPYLDWVCLNPSIDILSSKRLNYLIRDDGSRILLQTVAKSPHVYATPIYLISGMAGVKPGRLLAGRSCLGSLPGQALCETWTVIMDKSLGIIPGECGSVVVDQETFDVYGHLVGTDVLGHGHVVPLSHTIAQIKAKYSVNTVILPNTVNEVSGMGTSQSSQLELQRISRYLVTQPRQRYPETTDLQDDTGATIRDLEGPDSVRSLVNSLSLLPQQGLLPEGLGARLPPRPIAIFEPDILEPDLCSINSDSDALVSSQTGPTSLETLSNVGTIGPNQGRPYTTRNATRHDDGGLFTCPFAMKANYQDHRCHRLRFENVVRVKQHLGRTHYSDKEQNSQAEQLTCEQFEKIKRQTRARDDHKQFKYWWLIFYIIFPGDLVPGNRFDEPIPTDAPVKGPEKLSVTCDKCPSEHNQADKTPNAKMDM